MKKPRELDCKKLCESYPCDKTECKRKKGFRNGGAIVMLNERDSLSYSFNMAMREYRELGDITDNGNNLRKKLI